MIDVVRRVAEGIFIPFSVGGGIRTVEDMRRVILAGAEKISVNSAAVKNPPLISEGARAFGNQCIVLGMDVKKVEKSRGHTLGLRGRHPRRPEVYGDRRPAGGQRRRKGWGQARSASIPSTPTAPRTAMRSNLPP